MASKGGPRAVGTDGSDFSHREQIDSRYIISSTNKYRLKIVMFSHLLIGILMVLRQTTSICAVLNIKPPDLLYQLNLPQVLPWEVCWLPSLVSILFGFAALPRNHVFLMKQYVLGVIVLGIIPTIFGIVITFPELFVFMKTRQSKITFKGFSMEIIWTIFLIIAIQIHIFSGFIAWKLINSWTVKKTK